MNLTQPTRFVAMRSRFRIVLSLCGLVLAAPAWSADPAPASRTVADTLAIKRKQDDQQRARAMTRELVSGILDIQLRQLEENGLSDLPVFGDIQLMREHLDQLMETEMPRVVDVLAKAQLDGSDREAVFVEARGMIREIVLKLTTERQALLRRLRIAELAEQVRRLIRVETQVEAATRRLPTEAAIRQAEMLLRTIQDQEDGRQLFLALVGTLGDVSNWGGATAAAANDGLRLLAAADIGTRFDSALARLNESDFATAGDEQASRTDQVRGPGGSRARTAGPAAGQSLEGHPAAGRHGR
jgi:hypothetical protein